MKLPRSTDRVGTQQCRGVVGLPMMVLALVIGKGSSNDNGGCSDKINYDDDGRFDVWCVERGLQYNFSHQMNNYLFCMKI
jgi:hypothetical protein